MKRCSTLLGVILLLGCQSNKTKINSVTGPQIEPKVITTPAVAAPSFTWGQDYDQALAAAKETKRIVMIDVYTDWCIWCKRLDKDAFSNNEIGARLAKDFVSVKINPEKSEKNAALAKQLGVRGYPYIAFLDAEGKKLAEISGYLTADQFLRRINEVAEQAKKK